MVSHTDGTPSKFGRTVESLLANANTLPFSKTDGVFVFVFGPAVRVYRCADVVDEHEEGFPEGKVGTTRVGSAFRFSSIRVTLLSRSDKGVL